MLVERLEQERKELPVSQLEISSVNPYVVGVLWADTPQLTVEALPGVSRRKSSSQFNLFRAIFSHSLECRVVRQFVLISC